MSNLAIRVENLSKRYYIGQGKTAAYETLSERITDMLTSPIRSMRSVLQGQSSAVASDSIWALKDVSFEVEHGEVVGIIGRNGAGKSTLLKILSQITEPTSGYVDLYGRIGALLEVGTGFHPELTGRENVFLNGAILGMSRNDIQRKFDEIVDFSGVEKFIDTPVKHYSSGMQVRLAFAVAAHLEPEILVVDEVLAVGDAEFQKRCLGKMGDVTKEGRTVLFVSHNMAAVSSLCNRAILLEEGQMRLSNSTDEVINTYLYGVRSRRTKYTPGIYDVSQRKNREKAGRPIIQKVRLENATGETRDAFMMGESMTIVAEVNGMKEFKNAYLGISFFNNGQHVTTVSAKMTGQVAVDHPRQRYEEAVLHIAHLPFTPGSFWIDASINAVNYGKLDYIENAAEFDIVEADVYSSGFCMKSKHGLIYLNASFEVRPVKTSVSGMEDVSVS
jgi:lipopolysaccharide transport system ATP-binding protein